MLDAIGGRGQLNKRRLGIVADDGMETLGLRLDRPGNLPELRIELDRLGLRNEPPTQLPSGLPQGWFFDVLRRANPVDSALAYISSILVNGHSWTQDLSYLITPLLTAIIAGGALVLAGPRLVRLTPGVNAG